MRHFTADASASLGGPAWLATRRAEALERLGQLELPTADGSEVWRYSPIDQLDLDTYRPSESVSPDGLVGALALADEFGGGPVVVLRNGRIEKVERAGLPESVGLVAASSLESEPDGLGAVVGEGDAFVALNDGFAHDVLVVEVPAGVELEQPIVIVHWCDGDGEGRDGPAPSAFPRALVRVGEAAQAQVVEVFGGPSGDGRALVVPVVELVVESAGRLDYLMVQDLGPAVWSLGRIGASVGADATLRSFTAGLGGGYDRCRFDASAVGTGGSTAITSVYLGTGDQIHDVRTMQDHAAPKTTSDLLCKGAVADRSRSIYSGLIRMRHGAVRSDAMQTNHNLVLDESAHADSVPKLDIEENDVRCSHASSVGPVSEDQLYYLESRGLAPDRAERLIVLGFFDDIVERAPVASARDALRRRIGHRLGGLLAHREDAGE